MKRKIVAMLIALGVMSSVVNAEIISKDGIAKDTVTGLEWKNDRDVPKYEKNLGDAKQYCKDLNLGGYKDWRLPNIYELATLVDNTKSTQPYIIEGLQDVALSTYWSSTPIKHNTEYTWIIYPQKGRLSNSANTNYNYTQCVRGEELNFDVLSLLKKKGEIKISKEELNRISLSPEAEQTEESACNEVITQKTVVIIEKYLKQFPDGICSSIAKRDLENAIYNEASSQNTITSYKAYLKQFPNGEYASEASQKIDGIAYNQAKNENSVKAYREYLTKYPNGQYVSSAKSNIEYLEEQARYSEVLNSKDPQDMYLKAVKYETNGERGRAKKIYLTIMDKFSKSPMAIKAADRIASLSDVQSIEDSNYQAKKALEKSESNRRSKGRQECENNKIACIAGCGGFVSGADSHNSNMWQCKNKCEQISCH